ncbi:ParA family protein [Actinacidiphila glaucinigra]|uniref:ParA family protein n=1 Tax=Actinacidiphila glaucinigra TaxID=235986 RepID=UPI003D8F8413
MKLYTYDDMASRLDIVRQFQDLTDQGTLVELVSQIRPHLRNVIGVTIGKGGVGKTTVATNLAYVLAEEQAQRAKEGRSALPVLYIELDANGNSRNDFGLRGTEFDDDARAFIEAVVADKSLTVVKDARPYLDVVPSGAANGELATQIGKLNSEHGLAAFLLLALLIAQISHHYRWIVIDFSPSDKNNQRLGISAVTHMIAPIKGSDDGVLEGLAALARLVRGIRVINPEAWIAAIAFLGFKKVKGEPTSELINLREKIVEMVVDANMSEDVVMSSYVREAPVLAALCRNTGMPAKELALAASGRLTSPVDGDIVPRPRDENGRYVDSDKAADLADDYTNLAAEVIRQVRQRNKELQVQA